MWVLVVVLVAVESKAVSGKRAISSSSASSSSGSSQATCAQALGNCYRSRCCAPSKGVQTHACFPKRGIKFAQCRLKNSACGSDWLCPGNETSVAAPSVLDTRVKPAGTPPPSPSPLPKRASSPAKKLLRVTTGRAQAPIPKPSAAESTGRGLPATTGGGSKTAPAQSGTGGESHDSGGHNLLWAAVALVLVLVSLVGVFFPLLRHKLGF